MCTNCMVEKRKKEHGKVLHSGARYSTLSIAFCVVQNECVYSSTACVRGEEAVCKGRSDRHRRKRIDIVPFGSVLCVSVRTHAQTLSM